jgi:hypothetical protein
MEFIREKLSASWNRFVTLLPNTGMPGLLVDLQACWNVQNEVRALHWSGFGFPVQLMCACTHKCVDTLMLSPSLVLTPAFTYPPSLSYKILGSCFPCNIASHAVISQKLMSSHIVLKEYLKWFYGGFKYMLYKYWLVVNEWHTRTI